MNAIILNFKERNFKLKIDNGKHYIWDIIRKKFVVLTPEEWVRQHLIWVLVEEIAYPKSLIAVEKEIIINKSKKCRFDIVLYDEDIKPFMIIECKEPAVTISDDTVYQLLRYQSTLQAKYLMATNGGITIITRVVDNQLVPESRFPDWN